MAEWLIKDLHVINAHPTLIDVATYVQETHGLIVITSEYRPGDPGVHGVLPLRALDLRCRNRDLGDRVASDVNGKWAYDPDRPEKCVCLPHGEGMNFHIHLQVHSKTERRA